MNLKGTRFENSRLGMEIFVYDVNGEEMFIGKDIAKLLGYSNPSTAVSENIKPSQKKKVYVRTVENIGDSEIPKSEIINNNLTMITEIGVYQLVFRSNRKEAEEFQNWVYEEVLPSLRENGIYAEQNITSQQLESYVKENENLRTAIKNYSAGVADSKNLNRYLTKRFPNIKDAYNQMLVEFKRIGILGDDMLPTEKFKVSNQKEKWITYSVNISSDEKIAIILTSKGINIMSKIIHEEDGRIVLRKFESSI